ncbi:MAG: SEC-C domain-containing protein [Acidobacteriota bacterium]|nr:SEC-C domain-containing protein [Acidobacteriota bacterium]
MGRNDPCCCGSGKRFKQCCGIRSRARPAAHPALEVS